MVGITTFALAYIISGTFLDLIGDIVVALGGTNPLAPPSFLILDSTIRFDSGSWSSNRREEGWRSWALRYASLAIKYFNSCSRSEQA